MRQQAATGPLRSVRRAASILTSAPGRKLFAVQALAAFAVTSGAIQFVAALSRAFPPYPAVTFAVTLACCAAWGLLLAYPRLTLRHRMAGTDITLTVVVGDLFAQDTHIAVGFSDMFDTAVSDDRVIDRTSLQGQLLHRVYGDDRQRLDRELSAALAGVGPAAKESRAAKPQGKLTRYPLGTVAVLGQPRRHIFAAAYSRMGNDLTVRAPVEDLWYCYSQLWSTIGRRGQRAPVSVPLMGAGLARVSGLDHENLMRLIVLSFTAHSRTELVCSELRIVIAPAEADRIDLLRLREFLSTF